MARLVSIRAAIAHASRMNSAPALDQATIDRVGTIWRRFGLSLDIPVIDTQHLWLIAIIVRLESLLESPESEDTRAAFQAALADAVDYGAEHFALEEYLLEEAGYEGLRLHVRGHTRFIANLRLRARHVEGSESRESARKLLQALKHWLYQHILSEDGNYAKYFEEKHIDLARLAEHAVESGAFVIREEHRELYYHIVTAAPPEQEMDRAIIDAVARIWHRYRLKTGIVIVDIQHLWLIRMIAELDVINRRRMKEAKISDESRRLFNGILLQTVDYINQHFQAEEEIMRHFNFPGLAGHVNAHRAFAGSVSNRGKVNPADDPQVVARLVADLKEWLISHIAVEDVRSSRGSFRTLFCNVLDC